ncbi:MAG: tRNA pseudouridine(54/55) synthase Pus10 [Candidatus Anstonellaceae archaeon]
MSKDLDLLEENLYKLSMTAIQLAKKYPKSKTFYLQTHVDKKLVVKLEDFENTPPKNFKALKNIINKKVLDIFKKNSNLILDQQDPDLFISLDFVSNVVSVKHSNIYIYTNYLKKSREFAQHVWACSCCRGKGCQNCNFKKEKYPSIESSLREIFIKVFKASDMYLHSSGREDVDVLTLGNGRPSIIEIVNPQIDPTEINLDEVCKLVKEKYPIELLNPKYVKKFWVEAICTSHFNKEYLALVSCKEKKLNLEDFEKLKKLVPLSINQRTPLRVVKRRSDLIRNRYILDIALDKIVDGKLLLKIYAEAGTYIKEFVHGDGGRTTPSISSILGCSCICEELTLIRIDDFFVNTIKS